MLQGRASVTRLEPHLSRNVLKFNTSTYNNHTGAGCWVLGAGC